MTGTANSHMFETIQNKFKAIFLDSVTLLSPHERSVSAFGALLGIGMCGWMVHFFWVDAHWLIAPIGASAVILFAISHSPLAQPWSVIGGYTIATLISLMIAQVVPMPLVSAALAVAASIWLMSKLNCIHPPAGAVAVMLGTNGAHPLPHIEQTVYMVALNVGAILLATFLINNFLLRRRYPYSAKVVTKNEHNTRDASPLRRNSLNHSDLTSAIKTLDTFVDVQEDELVELYNLAVDHAFDRHIGLTCEDIMSTDVVTIHFDTPLEEGWQLLRKHKISGIPVVDNFDRLIGILSVADYLRQMDETSAAGLAIRLQGLLRRTPGESSDKAEVVGQIMSHKVHSATTDTPVAELVHSIVEKNLHHIPIVDSKLKVLGIVTLTDTVAALYKRTALSAV